MPDKEKRKSNPRRRTLIRLIIGIVIIVALISAGIVALRPKGAQIVFIAPDDNGVNNIWIADLNDPEHPRQLTFQPHGDYIDHRSVRVAQNNIIVYRTQQNDTIDSAYDSIWRLQILTGQYERLRHCIEPVSCNHIFIHPNGQWIAYEVSAIENGIGIRQVIIENLHTSERRILYEFSIDSQLADHSLLDWVEDTELLAFIQFSDFSEQNNQLVFYDVEVDRLVHTVDWHRNNPGYFAPDGSRLVIPTNQLSDDVWALYLHDISDENILPHQINITASECQLDRYHFQDWYHDSHALIFTGRWRHQGDLCHIELILYDVITETSTPLIRSNTQRYYLYATFNAEGSQILFVAYDWMIPQSQIMLYDMETREEIALPLFGGNPQWVNGGR